MVIAIGGREGPPQFICAGLQDRDSGPPAGPDTIYRIYSMTKPIAGIAAMLLVEDGKLTLDTPLAEIFPEFSDMQVLTDPENSTDAAPATRPILIRHVLTHSAGFAYAMSAPPPLKQLYIDGGGETARATREIEAARPQGLLPFAAGIARLPLLYEPGTTWHDSIALDIAGAVVEKVSGIGFDRFCRERIFAPLGMDDTDFFLPSDKLDRLAAHYRRTDGGLELIETGENSNWAYEQAFPVGGSGLASTARDYARFMAMLLGEGEVDGVRVMKAETARLAMSDMMEPGVMAATHGDHDGYGAGGRVVVADIPGGEAAGTYGWSGAANTYAFVDRRNAIYTVLMTQVMEWYPSPLHAEFTRAFYADLAAGG
jgi:CubicO group peptidase (beta-lactamase class C family)